MMQSLAIFDLDHTLLDGDSDALWCAFLIDEGVLDGASFGPRNAETERGYRAGSISTQAFCDFYIGTLAGRTSAQWQPLRQRFVDERVLPRIKPGTAALLRRHRQQGDLLMLSTATNRFITEPTASALGFEHLIGTDCDTDDQGRFTGRTRGTPNMRAGKIENLSAWLAARGQTIGGLTVSFYSDSMNDLPLLEAAQQPVAVDPEPALRALATARGWPIVSLLS